MLKRYLRSTYNMSPDDYRKRWGLPADYPMVAPAYAARRSEFAKKIGLGKGVRQRTAKFNFLALDGRGGAQRRSGGGSVL